MAKIFSKEKRLEQVILIKVLASPVHHVAMVQVLKSQILNRKEMKKQVNIKRQSNPHPHVKHQKKTIDTTLLKGDNTKQSQEVVLPKMSVKVSMEDKITKVVRQVMSQIM